MVLHKTPLTTRMCNAHVLKEVKTVKQLYHKHENEAVAIFLVSHMMRKEKVKQVVTSGKTYGKRVSGR